MPRVDDDIVRLLKFVAQPWGRPKDRQRDINACIDAILEWPTAGKVHARRWDSGVQLRRHDARQFAVIYAYFPPNQTSPAGVVSIRAVRHRRAKNVFWGVREESAVYGEA